MKQLIIFLFSITFITACNNNKNPRLRNDNGGLGGGGDDTRSNWTSKDRNKWMDECEGEIPGNPQSKQICSCVLDKLEKKYSDLDDANKKSSKDEVTVMTRACVAGGGGGGDEDNNGFGRKKKIEGNEEEDGGRGWTNSQRQKFIDDCAGSAKQSLGAAGANSYCECMQNKIEKKYNLSFDQANKLTKEDLSTPEAKADIQDCKGGNNNDN